MDKVIGECPDDTSSIDIQEGVHNKDDDEKEITADNEDEGVKHRDVIEYEKETNWDTLYKVIGKFPDDTSPI